MKGERKRERGKETGREGERQREREGEREKNRGWERQREPETEGERESGTERGGREIERVTWQFVPWPLQLLRDKAHVGVRGHDCFASDCEVVYNSRPAEYPSHTDQQFMSSSPPSRCETKQGSLFAVWAESTGNKEYW